MAESMIDKPNPDLMIDKPNPTQSSKLKKVEEDKIQPIRPNQVELQQHAYNVFSVRVPANIIPEQLCDPELYVHVINKLKMGDELRIIPEDFSYRAEVIVSYTDGKDIRLRPISCVPLDPVNSGKALDPMSKANYRLLMRGQQKWCIQRLSDGDWIKSNIPTKGEAETWLMNYINKK